MIKEALDYAANGLKIAEELDSKLSIARSNVIFGKLFASIHDFKKSENYFKKGIKILNKLKQKKTLADAYFDYAKMLEENSTKETPTLNLANEYFNKARKIYTELKFVQKAEECARG